jgi:hypothetical protein
MTGKNLEAICGLCLCAILVCLSADIAFSQAAGNTSAPAISPQAKITVEDMDSKTIVLKPEEKVALMFMQTIAGMERDCKHHAGHLCSLEELVAGPKSPDWNMGKLKFDPAGDKNYKYTVTISGSKWEGHADPQRKGLGGWFYDGSFFIARSYFNPSGPATPASTRTGTVLIDGDSFKAR